MLGKTEESAKRLSQQLANTSQGFYNKQGINTQPVADFIKGEAVAGGSLSTKTADYLRDMQKANTEQIIKVFDKAQPDSKLTVFGKQIEQVLGDGGSNKLGTTKVFSSQGLTDMDIRNYAQSLAGDVLLEERITPLGIIYIAKKEGRQTINLRNFSNSSDTTNARWTIDVINNEDVIKSTGKTSIDKVEIKFR